jgi:hypothetical protein
LYFLFFSSLFVQLGIKSVRTFATIPEKLYEIVSRKVADISPTDANISIEPSLRSCMTIDWWPVFQARLANCISSSEWRRFEVRN